jgi:hypothetical protein
VGDPPKYFKKKRKSTGHDQPPHFSTKIRNFGKIIFQNHKIWGCEMRFYHILAHKSGTGINISPKIVDFIPGFYEFYT